MSKVIVKLINNLITKLPDSSLKKEEKESIEDKVDRYIIMVESNSIDSEYEYNYLKSLYKRLCKVKRLSPRYRELRVKLKDVMLKYGKYDNDKEILNAEDIFRDQELNNGYNLDDY